MAKEIIDKNVADIRKLVKENKLKDSVKLKFLLRKRAIRTMSGIAPVAVLTKPWECPGKCAFCPTEIFKKYLGINWLKLCLFMSCIYRYLYFLPI